MPGRALAGATPSPSERSQCEEAIIAEPYHPVLQPIRTMLADHELAYEFFEHEPVRTSEEAAAVRPGYALQQGAKAMALRIRGDGLGGLPAPGRSPRRGDEPSRFLNKAA